MVEQFISAALRKDKRDPAKLTPREAVRLERSKQAVDRIYVGSVHRYWLKRQSLRGRVWWWVRRWFWKLTEMV